jgi:hypothetical protein
MNSEMHFMDQDARPGAELIVFVLSNSCKLGFQDDYVLK